VTPETSTPTATWAQWLPRTRTQRVALGVSVASEVYFLVFFDGTWLPTVDLAWAVAVATWLLAFWRADVDPTPRLRHPFWFYGLYVAALLPFATNWRWVLAADNLSWPLYALEQLKVGPVKTLLSVNGADNFGYLQTNLHNVFMFVVAPTLFWHRVGKITVGLLALSAVYSVFARLVAPRFGLLVAACAATTSIVLVYTYASVPFVDGIASGYALLAIGLWVRRSPASQQAWLLLGFLSGFMLFLTPNGWFMALCVWGWLGVQVLWRRWHLSYLVLAGVTGLIVGLPMLIQWSHGTGGQLFSLVGNAGLTVPKVLRFLHEAAFMPFASEVDNSGAFGPQLPIGFRWLFIPGILITPLFPRRFPGARFILGLYVLHVVVLAFTQGPYAGVSVKRAMFLIPMAAYFVFLPYHHYLRTLPVILPVIALWAGLGVRDLVMDMKPGRTGYTFLDGIVEAHQRFSDTRVCVLVSGEDRAASFAPGSLIDQLYAVTPQVLRVTDVHEPSCGDVLCYDPGEETLDLEALGYRKVEMLNTTELRCGRRSPPGDGSHR